MAATHDVSDKYLPEVLFYELGPLNESGPYLCSCSVGECHTKSLERKAFRVCHNIIGDCSVALNMSPLVSEYFLKVDELEEEAFNAVRTSALRPAHCACIPWNP